ncbi:MAG: hypothetical protein ACTSQE_03685 [Candidatus Heimdallarchaeaceae archaeon]
MLFGKKLSSSKEKEVTQIEPARQTEVRFYKLSDVVKAERIVNEVKTGNLIFLNIGRINPYPDRKKKFLTALKLCAAESQTTVRMISEDTIMVAPQTIPIQIRNLSPLEQDDTVR